MTDINKLRQVKEYSDQGGTYTVPYKGADAVWKPEDGDIHQKDLDKAAAEGSKEFWPEDIKENLAEPKEFSEIYKEVANKVIDDIEHQLFELINEYSDDYDELYWNRYLNDDAPVELLDAAFENYHKHYDNIFKIIMSKLNNTK